MRARRLPSPTAVVALLALFFALGGSALALGERLQAGQAARCAAGTVRGAAYVTGNPAVGIANTPDRFSGAANLFGHRFNCTGKAVQVRRTGMGVYEVRFVGNPARAAVTNGVGRFTTSVEPLGPGLFRVYVYVVARDDEADASFVVIAA